jgi:phage-related protein
MNAHALEAFGALLPTLLQIISAILGVLLIRISTVAKTRWGIEIEARHREALQTALMSGIQAALSRGESGPDAISSAVKHAAESVPDAITALKPASGVLASIAEGKLRDALGGTASNIVSDLRVNASGGGALVLATIEDALRRGDHRPEVRG